MARIFESAFNAVITNGVVKLEKSTEGRFTADSALALLQKLAENKTLKAFDRWSFYIEGVNEKLTDPKATLKRSDMAVALAMVAKGDREVSVEPNRFGKPVLKVKSAKAKPTGKAKVEKIIIE